MWEDIGNKIKLSAKIIFWVEIVATVILMMFFIDSGAIMLATLIVGCLTTWLTSMVLYGFGELVGNTTYMRQSLYNMEQALKNNIPAQENQWNQTLTLLKNLSSTQNVSGSAKSNELPPM